MDLEARRILWQQFGAAIDMLENAIDACPDALWGDRSRMPEYWYVVYHTLFWLDFYHADDPKAYVPPPPYNLDELDPAGLLPGRVYTKDEMRAFLEHGRRRSRDVIATLTDERGREPRAFGSVACTLTEMLLYSMRHVQHHAAQLNLILRQTIDSAPRWVGRARLPFPGDNPGTSAKGDGLK